MIIAMSTQLCYGPSPALNDVNPFLDAVMAQVRSRNLNIKIWLFSCSVSPASKFQISVLLSFAGWQCG